MSALAPTPVVRDFRYINSRKRRPSDYEAFNLYVQPKIGDWWDKGNSYLRTPSGRPAFVEESTLIRVPDWYEFRDPSGLWQRPYMRMQAEQERAIERLTEDVTDSVAADLDSTWVAEILAGHYAVWPFVEYGLYRGLISASREGLSDTIVSSILFSSFDRARHQQDIVRYLMMLEEQLPGFDSTGAKRTWMDSPRYQPLRRLVEEIGFATADWCEVVVATNLCLDLIVSEVAVHRLIGHQAPFHGDMMCRLIVNSVERDRARDLAYTEEFVRMVTADDVPQAAANRDILAGWIEKWTPKAVDAVMPMQEVYAALPTSRLTFADELVRAQERQGEILGKLGIGGTA